MSWAAGRDEEYGREVDERYEHERRAHEHTGERHEPRSTFASFEGRRLSAMLICVSPGLLMLVTCKLPGAPRRDGGGAAHEDCENAHNEHDAAKAARRRRVERKEPRIARVAREREG